MTIGSEHSLEDISSWLTDRVAGYVDVPGETIKSDVPLGEYGLDSVSAFTVCSDIEDHLGLDLEPTVLPVVRAEGGQPGRGVVVDRAV